MKEYIERGKIDFRIPATMESDGEILVPLSAVRQAIAMTPAANVVSHEVLEQVKWERDVAMQQLEEHGIPFGAKADVVEVVRCKDCQHSNFEKSCSKYRCGYWLGMLRFSNDFCSYGIRKEQT